MGLFSQIFLEEQHILSVVMRVEACSFSGFRIYPGHGFRFIRSDSKTFAFANGKLQAMFHRKVNPRKIYWTVIYRRVHRKGAAEEASKKKTQKVQRAIEGASLDAIKARRNQKPEVRAAAREAALREIKEKRKQEQAKKAAQKKTTDAKKADAPKKAAAPKKQQASKDKASAPKGGAKAGRR